jgi:hypothetical protein
MKKPVPGLVCDDVAQGKNFPIARNHCSLADYCLSGAEKANFEPPNATIGSPVFSCI